MKNGWRESDGGHLRVYLDYEAGPREMATPKDAPYSVLHAGAGAASPSSGYIDVPPAAGTLVVFKSDTVPHEVMPTSAKRVAIVGWFNRALTEAEAAAASVDEAEMSPLAAAIYQHYRERGEAVKF